MTLAVYDMLDSNAQSALRGANGIFKVHNISLFDEDTEQSVCITAKDALRFADWVYKCKEQFPDIFTEDEDDINRKVLEEERKVGGCSDKAVQTGGVSVTEDGNRLVGGGCDVPCNDRKSTNPRRQENPVTLLLNQLNHCTTNSYKEHGMGTGIEHRKFLYALGFDPWTHNDVRAVSYIRTK